MLNVEIVSDVKLLAFNRRKVIVYLQLLCISVLCDILMCYFTFQLSIFLVFELKLIPIFINCLESFKKGAVYFFSFNLF